MSIQDYRDLIARKKVAFQPNGIEPRDLPNSLFDHQRHGVEFALRCGRSALFYDTGLGKTAMAISWADHVIRHTNKPVLMLAPLAVGPQHVREAARLGIDAQVIRDASTVAKCVNVLNYDRLDKVDANDFGGVILDESSILKSFTGQTTKKLIGMFRNTPFRLACTATPAPNDHTELGTHAEFLSIMRRDEMLPIWFIHDSADTGTWRIKGHAQDDFWRWVASWARCVGKPSDIGFDDSRFVLPELVTHRHEVIVDVSSGDTGAEKDGQARLFRIPEMSATSVHREKRNSLAQRADVIADVIAAEHGESWIVWVETNDEADTMIARLPADCTVEVRGNQTPDEKERKLVAFSEGKARIIITKPSIAGFGLNWQHCARQAFVGLSFSYESYYQAVRRSWRFGQSRPVHVHIACADTERTIYDTVSRKAGDHGVMKKAMEKAMREASEGRSANVSYNPKKEAMLPAWMTQ